jgi:hypothetical protein
MGKMLGNWMGWIAAAAAAVISMLVLRMNSAPATLSTAGLLTTAIQFESREADRPLLSETARSRQISFTGFSSPELGMVVSESPFTLERSDQLHVKDLYASENSRVQIALNGTSLTLVTGLPPSQRLRSFGRIGVGDKVWLKTEGGTRHQIGAGEGNISMTCGVSSCAIVLVLLDPVIDELVRPFDIRRLSLRIAGSDAESVSAAQVSSIREGKIVVSARDLFGVPYTVRSLTLSAGDALILDPIANGRVRIGTQKGLFKLSFSLEGGRNRFVPRVGDEILLAPSILEILIREPWHKTLWGVVLALIPMIIQFASFVRRRISLKLEEQQWPRITMH